MERLIGSVVERLIEDQPAPVRVVADGTEDVADLVKLELGNLKKCINCKNWISEAYLFLVGLRFDLETVDLRLDLLDLLAELLELVVQLQLPVVELGVRLGLRLELLLGGLRFLLEWESNSNEREAINVMDK